MIRVHSIVFLSISLNIQLFVLSSAHHPQTMARVESKAEKEKPSVSKEFIKEHMDGKEIDLSMCSLTKIPVKELVSLVLSTNERLIQCDNISTGLSIFYRLACHMELSWTSPVIQLQFYQWDDVYLIAICLVHISYGDWRGTKFLSKGKVLSSSLKIYSLKLREFFPCNFLAMRYIYESVILLTSMHN